MPYKAVNSFLLFVEYSIDKYGRGIVQSLYKDCCKSRLVREETLPDTDCVHKVHITVPDLLVGQ